MVCHVLFVSLLYPGILLIIFRQVTCTVHPKHRTQSPVGEAFLAAVHDVEMLEASPVAVTHWSPATIVPDSVSQHSTEKPAAVPTRSSSRVLEHRATIASVVTSSEVALLSSLQEIN